MGVATDSQCGYYEYFPVFFFSVFPLKEGRDKKRERANEKQQQRKTLFILLFLLLLLRFFILFIYYYLGGGIPFHYLSACIFIR